MKIGIRASLVPLFAFACASKPSPTGSTNATIRAIVRNADDRPRVFSAEGETYEVRVHNETVGGLMKNAYAPSEIREIENALAATMNVRLDERGLAQAADRDAITAAGAETDPTHYDAVWVRDNLWVALGQQVTPGGAPLAKKLILTLADYFSSAAQIARFETVIRDPRVLAGPDGAMNGVHIRFDRRSAAFEDVRENGGPQKWNHKQNDALGLFLDLYCREILSGHVTTKDLTPARRSLLTLFPKYFAATRFYEMEDAGSWEEIERVNASSTALVVSGLERLAMTPAGRNDRSIAPLIAKGYDRIRKNLAAGGESPDYPATDPRYRRADAALLNLIYPARLARLERKDFDRVLEIVQPLIGELGVRRYPKDSYQAGNFWFLSGSNTEDTSSGDAFGERAKRAPQGTEAQWFFDSWLSIVYGELDARFHDARYRGLRIRFLNRALGQVTGGSKSEPVLGADGKPVPSLALPESYNTVIETRSGARAFAPSPITPLNWAKATLRLALAGLSLARD